VVRKPATKKPTKKAQAAAAAAQAQAQAEAAASAGSAATLAGPSAGGVTIAGQNTTGTKLILQPQATADGDGQAKSQQYIYLLQSNPSANIPANIPGIGKGNYTFVPGPRPLLGQDGAQESGQLIQPATQQNLLLQSPEQQLQAQQQQLQQQQQQQQKQQFQSLTTQVPSQTQAQPPVGVAHIIQQGSRTYLFTRR
jgi:hypothetical protein